MYLVSQDQEVQASLRHIGRVEMDTGKSPRCGTGSTGKPSGAAQVGEWAEADPDGLTSVFCLGYTKHIPLVSWEGHLLPYELEALAST